MTDNSLLLSIIIPTLDAAATLRGCLRALEPGRRSGLVREIIISDGGSADATVELAASGGATVVQSPRGRGAQLAAGASAVHARPDQWLLFLHADTVLSPDWMRAVSSHMPSGPRRVGAFRLQFEGGGWRGRLVASGAMMRTRINKLPYGDQGLLIARDFYDALGGYAEMPLFEDVDLIDRIKVAGGSIDVLDADAVTSPARYVKDGYASRVLRNARCYRAFRRGVPIEEIVELYRP